MVQQVTSWRNNYPKKIRRILTVERTAHLLDHSVASNLFIHLRMQLIGHPWPGSLHASSLAQTIVSGR